MRRWPATLLPSPCPMPHHSVRDPREHSQTLSKELMSCGVKLECIPIAPCRRGSDQIGQKFCAPTGKKVKTKRAMPYVEPNISYLRDDR